jgi:hypothetical protein
MTAYALLSVLKELQGATEELVDGDGGSAGGGSDP